MRGSKYQPQKNNRFREFEVKKKRIYFGMKQFKKRF